MTLDRYIGANYDLYWPESDKLLGSVSKKGHNFIVNEVLDDYQLDSSINKRKQTVLLTSRYLHLTLVKKGISTFDCVNLISKHLGLPKESITYCGLKDTNAITTQRISIDTNDFDAKKIRINDLNSTKYTLKDPEVLDYPLYIGKHIGNKFLINVNLPVASKDIKKLNKIIPIMQSKGIPNFYGLQRFGPNRDNHIIGKKILLRDFKGATSIWIKDSIKFKHYRNEEQINEFANLLQKDNDPGHAFEKVQLGQFFVRAFHSFLFNKALSQLIKDGVDMCGQEVETLGYDTSFSKKTREIYKEILQQEAVQLANFKFEDYPGLSVKGGYRSVLFRPKNLTTKRTQRGIQLEFELEKGSYASVLLGFLLKNSYKSDWL